MKRETEKEITRLIETQRARYQENLKDSIAGDACFSLHVYRDSACPPLPDGWSVFRDCPPQYATDGFFGSAYFRCLNPTAPPAQQGFEIVIAYRGTAHNIFDSINDFLLFLGKAPYTFKNNALPFIKYVQAEFIKAYPESFTAKYLFMPTFTGHSLGAVLAELGAAATSITAAGQTAYSSAFSFDSPGSLEPMQDLVSDGVITPAGMNAARHFFGIWAHIDAVNCCNTQIQSSAYPDGFDSDFTFDNIPDAVSMDDYLRRYTIKNQHRMENFYKHWNRSSEKLIEQKTHQDVLDSSRSWPVELNGFAGEFGFNGYLTYVNNSDEPWMRDMVRYWDQYIETYWDAHPDIQTQYKNDYLDYSTDFIVKNLKTTPPTKQTEPRKAAGLTVEERLSQATTDEERLYIAVLASQHTLARELLDKGINPNTTHGYDKVPLLSIPVYIGDIDMLALLLEFNTHLDAQDKQGRTCLHEIAAKRPDDAERFAALLINQGANTQIKSHEGHTALEIARDLYGMGAQTKLQTVIEDYQKEFLPPYETHLETEDGIVLDKADQILRTSSAGPREYSCFSLHVYRDPKDCPPLPDGWSILKDCDPKYTQTGYFGSAYYASFDPNDPEDQNFEIVIAHRGTVPGSVFNKIEDFLILLGDAPVTFQQCAIPFIESVKAEFSKKHPKGRCNIQYTGHSLGALLAECSATKDHCLANVYESPGALEPMQNLVNLGVLTQDDVSKAGVHCYADFAHINAINTCNTQVETYAYPEGRGCYFTYGDNLPDSPSMIYYFQNYTMDQHGIKQFYDLYNQTGLEKDITPIAQSKFILSNSNWPEAAKGFLGGYNCYCTFDQSIDSEWWNYDMCLYWGKYIAAYWKAHPEIQNKYDNKEYVYFQWFVTQYLRSKPILNKKTADITLEERLAMAESDDEKLYVAVLKCEHQLARELLEKGANPNTLHSANKAPLLSVSLHIGNVEMFKLLLDFNADPNGEDKQGITALHEAVAKRPHDPEAFILPLLEKGANIHARTHDGKTALTITQSIYGEAGREKIQACFDAASEARVLRSEIQVAHPVFEAAEEEVDGFVLVNIPDEKEVAAENKQKQSGCPVM